jgi:hypothetical protein
MVNGWYWYSRFHSCFFTVHTSVSLQNGSNNDHHCVVSVSSQSTRVFLAFSTVLTSTGPLWQTRIVLESNLIMRHQTLPATIINFCRWTAQSFNSDEQSLLQYCNPTWSNFITNFKCFYTENKHNLLQLKYTNEESKVLTTNQYIITCIGMWSRHCTHSVRYFWHHPSS